MKDNAVRQVLDHYPKIFFACHTRHVRDPASGQTISSHQAGILDHLDTVEPTGLLDLAMHMGVTASTMSISTERLVQQGYVKRLRNRRDGRRIELRLTAAGERIKAAQSVLDPARVSAMLSHLDNQQRADALRGLSLLADAARKEMHNKALFGIQQRRRRGRTSDPSGKAAEVKKRTDAGESHETDEGEKTHEMGVDRRRRSGRAAADPGDRRDDAPKRTRRK